MSVKSQHHFAQGIVQGKGATYLYDHSNNKIHQLDFSRLIS